MMRSMFAGVAGLKNHQTRMDVIGNNIANVNTVGFKKSRVNFQDMLSQTMRGASSPQGTKGGTNPQQVGLGVTISSIDTLQTQGNLQSTGKMTDMSLQGDGFFIVSNGSDNVYTRAGAFDLDTNGDLINPNGLKVQGWKPVGGIINTKGTTGPLSVVVGSTMPPKATLNAVFANNLDANTVVNGTQPIPVTVYDSLGIAHDVSLNLKKTGANSWEVDLASVSNAAALPVPALVPAVPTVGFNASGAYNPGTSTLNPQVQFTPSGGANPVTITLDFTKLTQYASESTARATTQDGYQPGVLSSYTVDQTGTITGVYSNGRTDSLGQIAIANFSNPGGLVKDGENVYRKSNNSGEPDVGPGGKGGRGTIAPGSLEMSNVDLSQEFTDMITTQRGFQANSKIITTSDEMLQELVNLKR